MKSGEVASMPKRTRRSADTMKIVEEALRKAIDKAGPALLKQLEDAYKAQAERAVEHLKGLAKDTKRVGRLYEFGRDPLGRLKAFIVYDQAPARTAGASACWHQKWEFVRDFPQAWKPNYEEATRQARISYDGARRSFVDKNMGKLSSIMGHRKDLEEFSVRLVPHQGVFEGTVLAKLSDAEIQGALSLKYVVRTIPHVTPYYQYPLTFTKATVKGKTHKRPSEVELQELLGTADKRTQEEILAERGLCAGSGQYAPEGSYDPRRMSPYATCAACKTVVSVTRGGKYRTHQTASKEREVAAKKLKASGYCPMSREELSQETLDVLGPVDPYKDPKAICHACNQAVRLDADKEWIWGEFMEAGRPTKMHVKKARYFKHQLPKVQR